LADFRVSFLLGILNPASQQSCVDLHYERNVSFTYAQACMYTHGTKQTWSNHLSREIIMLRDDVETCSGKFVQRNVDVDSTLLFNARSNSVTCWYLCCRFASY